MGTLTVGVGKQFSTISSAVAASHDGDLIAVDAGTYTNDFATISTKITIQGVGGMVHLVATVAPPNGKAILVTTTDVTIDHLEFSGAAVADGNGAGIRYQGGNLTITNSFFHDNQEGLLGSDPTGTITITNSEFSHNGSGDGFTHNLYVTTLATLTITGSYFHDAVGGNEIKSRANNTNISNTRIIDGNGTAIYSVSLPNGGNAVLANNVIEQGPNGINNIIVTFGEEGGIYASSSLQLTGNTILNDLASAGARLLVNSAAGVTATLTNNSVYGLTSGQYVTGSANITGMTTLATEPAVDTSSPWNNASVTSGQTLIVSAGQSSNGVVFSGGIVDILSGGTGSFVLSGGGFEYVLAGGSASATTLRGGVEIVSAGGSAIADFVSGGTDIVFGTAVRTTINAGGSALILGTVVSATVNSGGTLRDFGTASATVVSGGGIEYVQSGCLASGTVVSGGVQVVSAGGTESRTVLNGGGVDYMLGRAVSTTLNNGGTNHIFGIAIGTIVNSGGIDFVEAGGTASGTVVNNGGADLVENGGLVSGATLSSGSIRAVFAGGTVSKTTVNGGAEYMLGRAVSTTINSGGSAYNFGVVSGTIVNNGAVDFVEVGGTGSGTVVNNGGVDLIENGGLAVSATISTGGLRAILAGGTASKTVISGGTDFNLGIAVSTTVNSGGTNFDYGIESGVIVNNGGLEFIKAGASASGSVINNGGIQIIENTGLVSGATVSVGGEQVVLAGGTASKTTIIGGTDFVFGTAVSTTIGSGGVMEVISGGSASLTTFAPGAGGFLRLDDSVHFTGLVAGFTIPDGIDLADIAYVSGVTTSNWTQLTSGANASGTLTVSGGGHAAHITLLGQYVVGNFHIQADGHGGTLVTDPPVGAATNDLSVLSTR